MFAGYRIEQVLDRGGMGVVYKAVDPDLDRQVALKIIAPEHTQDETAVARFKTECRLAASIEHANIVPIHRGGEFDGVLYLAMRFVPGTNLRKVIDRGPLELSQVARIVSQVASALDAAHEKGLVHRDVKPANILLSGDPAKPHVYLTDFGLTKRLGSNAEGLTREGGWVGTPDYVAPEQIQGHKVDRRADVYSLGCVLFEMLTGHVAYDKDSDMAKLWAHVSDPPPLPRTIRPELIASFDDIVARATAKDPEHRYATAGDLAEVTRDAIASQERARRRSAAAAPSAVSDDDLDATRAESISGASSAGAPPPPTPPPPAPPPPSPPARPRREPRADGAPAGAWLRRRAKPVAGLLVLLLGVVVAVVVLGGSDPEEKPRQLGQRIAGKLGAVPTNRVDGSGNAVMRLDGRRLSVTMTSSGLLNGAPHALHIHAGRKGTCPGREAAALHNGHLSIATHAGGPYYGPPVLAMTTTGDTSPKSILAFNRFPSSSDVAYKRTMTVTPIVASYLRRNNAVVVVHGIDYNRNGVYDGVLERSDLDRSLTGESTAPALCGPLVADKATTQTASAGGAGGRLVFTAALTTGRAAAAGPRVCTLHPPFGRT